MTAASSWTMSFKDWACTQDANPEICTFLSLAGPAGKLQCAAALITKPGCEAPSMLARTKSHGHLLNSYLSCTLRCSWQPMEQALLGKLACLARGD